MNTVNIVFAEYHLALDNQKLGLLVRERITLELAEKASQLKIAQGERSLILGKKVVVNGIEYPSKAQAIKALKSGVTTE